MQHSHHAGGEGKNIRARKEAEANTTHTHTRARNDVYGSVRKKKQTTGSLSGSQEASAKLLMRAVRE